MDVKLFGLWSSPFTQRVVWVLKLKGVKYEYIGEDIGNKSDLLLQHSPVYKKVPVLVHGGRAIAESMVIVEYIEETWPVNPILPHDPYERSVVRFWAKFIDEMSIPMMAFFKCTGENQELEIKKSMETLRIIEEQGLKPERKFFGGEEIGMADIALGWIVNILVVMEEIAGVKLIEAETFPGLHGWIQRFKGIEIIRENLPEHHKLLEYFKGRREFFVGSCHGSHHHHHHH